MANKNRYFEKTSIVLLLLSICYGYKDGEQVYFNYLLATDIYHVSTLHCP